METTSSSPGPSRADSALAEARLYLITAARPDLEEFLEAAVRGGVDASTADYLGVGPVHATPTKEGRPPVGLDLVRYAAAHARVPWFAIGGIDETNAADVIAAGATRI